MIDGKGVLDVVSFCDIPGGTLQITDKLAVIDIRHDGLVQPSDAGFLVECYLEMF